MSFLKSILANIIDKAKDSIGNQTNNRIEESIIEVLDSTQELVMLYLAESYKVEEENYQKYLGNRYGIKHPGAVLKKLQSEDYIRPTTALETLPHLKGTELKEIATKIGVKTSGTKEALSARITESVSEDDLTPLIKERYWAITDTGKEVLNSNKYIGFYLDKHTYSLNEIGIDINGYVKLFANTNRPVRDVIWGELNRRSLDYHVRGVSSRSFHAYCDVIRVMALFLEEEKRYKDALANYMRYLHSRANLEASLDALDYYSILKKVNDAANVLFMNSEIYPFQADEIKRISEGCGYDVEQLKAYMKEAFSKEKDTGIFTPEQLVDMIICGLNGDEEGQKSICIIAMKAAAKKIR